MRKKRRVHFVGERCAPGFRVRTTVEDLLDGVQGVGGLRHGQPCAEGVAMGLSPLEPGLVVVFQKAVVAISVAIEIAASEKKHLTQ